MLVFTQIAVNKRFRSANKIMHNKITIKQARSNDVAAATHGYATFRSGRFGLAVSVWPIRSGQFRSGDISVRIWNLAEISYKYTF